MCETSQNAIITHFLFLSSCFGVLHAQTALTWNEVRERFRQANPNLLAGQLNIEESRANKVTDGLRPNPEIGFVADKFRSFNPNPLQPFKNSQFTLTISQLIGRGNKRNLRVQSVRLVTEAAGTDQLDLERNLIFSLGDFRLAIANGATDPMSASHFKGRMRTTLPESRCSFLCGSSTAITVRRPGHQS